MKSSRYARDSSRNLGPTGSMFRLTTRSIAVIHIQVGMFGFAPRVDQKPRDLEAVSPHREIERRIADLALVMGVWVRPAGKQFNHDVVLFALDRVVERRPPHRVRLECGQGLRVLVQKLPQARNIAARGAIADLVERVAKELGVERHRANLR